MHPYVEIFWLCYLSIESPSFAHVFFSFVLILAKCLIHLKKLRGIFRNLTTVNITLTWKSMFSVILEGYENEGLGGVCESKLETPSASVGDQSSPKLTLTLFASLPYARNRSLDKDLFCGGSSARLPSTSHAHKNELSS